MRKTDQSSFVHGCVLIVDDDESTCDLLKTILEPTYKCIEAHSLREARRRLSEAIPFDVALLDLHLPDGRGADFLEEINLQVGETIVLTVSKDVRMATDLMAQGAFYYLTKDSTPEEIRSIVVRAVAAARDRRRVSKVEKRLDALSNEIQTLKGSLREELWHFLEAEKPARHLRSKGKLKDALGMFEKRLLLYALDRYKWHRQATAQALGVHLNTLLLKIRRYGLKKSRPPTRKIFASEGE